jgi:sugar phosphate isomerase/epimerase
MAPKPPMPIIRWKLGVLDRSLGLPGDPEAVAWATELLFPGLAVSLGAAKNAGHGVDLADKGVQKRYREAARKSKCTLTALSLEAADPAALEALLAGALPVAKGLGVPVVRVTVPGAGRTETEREFIGYLLGKIAPAAQKAGVVLAMSSSLPAREAVALIEAARARGVKISYDVGAAARAKLDVVEELRWLAAGKKLCEVHLRESAGYLGKGSVDCAAVIATLADVGFDRWVHLATDAPSGDPEADTLENQRYVRGLMRAHSGG